MVINCKFSKREYYNSEYITTAYYPGEDTFSIIKNYWIWIILLSDACEKYVNGANHDS